MAIVTDTTADTNGNIIIDVSSSADDSITLATAGTYSDKNIIFNLAVQKGAAEPVLQEKNVTPSTVTQEVIPDAGYDGLSKVNVEAMSIATQATPSVSIDSSGLITATATQTAGYVEAGTKSATKQLAFQAAKTITPTTTSQIAVSSGYYTGGDVTVKGDSNLVAENIKSGVSIFGVNGTYEGSGGNTDIEDSIINRTITNYTNDRITTIGNYAFYDCSSLTSISFPTAKYIGSSAFQHCHSLTSVNFPAAKYIGNAAFQYCYNLTSVNFPAVTSIDYYTFYNCFNLTSVSFPTAKYISSYAFVHCSSLTSISFPAATSIGYSAFTHCSKLTELYLMGSSLCQLSASNAFSSTPIKGYTTVAGKYGSIYVPASLLESYKKATNWTYFSNRFVGI